MGPCYFFLCLCLQGIWTAWRGERGGPPKHPTKEPPFRVRGTSAGCNKSREGLVSDDGVGPLRLTRRRDPGPHPTKGFVPLYSGLEVGTDDGAVWSQWSPTKGPAAGGGELSLMMGHAARMRSEAPDSPAGH